MVLSAVSRRDAAVPQQGLVLLNTRGCWRVVCADRAQCGARRRQETPTRGLGVRESELRRVLRPGSAHCSTTDVGRELERAASASVRIQTEREGHSEGDQLDERVEVCLCVLNNKGRSATAVMQSCAWW